MDHLEALQLKNIKSFVQFNNLTVIIRILFIKSTMECDNTVKHHYLKDRGILGVT